MHTSRSYRTNRDLFSNYYLDEHLPRTEAWDTVDDERLRDAREEIRGIWAAQKDTVAGRTESSLEEKFVRPVFRVLGIPFDVEEAVQGGRRRPDYGFFPSEEAARDGFRRKEEGGDFYGDAVAVADAKRWGRPLDTRGSGEHERDFGNPSYQIHVYLQETPARWAVLTNGEKWRLYYGPTSHRLDSYYEVDLPAVLERGDLEDFGYFYRFFRHEAFLEDASGDCFLDDVYDESNVFARELGEDLQDNVYEAITVLSEGFLEYPDNDLSAADLDLVHDSSLIYLYRLIFVLYAEADGRELLDTSNEIYEESYSLNSLKREVAEELDGAEPAYRDWQDDLWERLDELFELVDRGSRSRGIPEADLYVPAYNGGLFRTDPKEDPDPEAVLLAENRVGDSYLARVVELVTRSRNGNGGGKAFVDYSSLDVRHLGSIYEGLLEYQLNVADEPLALDDGEYVTAGEDDEVTVEAGEVYLTTDSDERKATGSYYTPEYVVEYVVENTLGPLVEEIREDLVGKSASGESGVAGAFAERVFDLKVLDPAMGSGHFLTSAVDYLAREIVDVQERQAAREGVETVDEEHDVNWARRQVAQRCIYGVDLNPLAVELAKVSLWLRTLAAEQPLAFLDHHLKTGNSLVGSDVATVLDDGDSDDDGQLTLVQSFDRTRRRALEHVTDRFQDLLSIDNETLDDVKEMEAVFEEVRDDPLYRHLLAMANVHTAAQFGLDVPDDAFERMAAALRDDSWGGIEGRDWFRSAQAMAEEESFFHWELEFPIAFYERDGTRSGDAGFDAVIGNPPYVNIVRIPDGHVDYLNAEWDTAVRRFDLYVLFSELAYEIGRPGARHAYVVPDKILTESYGAAWREVTLDEHGLERILDLREENVFEDATNDPIVFTIGCHRTTDSVAIEERDGAEVTPRVALPIEGFAGTPGSRIRIDWTEQTERLLRTIREDAFPLSRIAYASWGAQPGNASRFVFDERPDGKENVKRLIKGSDVERYVVEYGDRYLWYDRDELHRPAFPGLFESEKLCLRKVAGRRGLVGAYDDDQYYTEDSVINLIRKADLVDADDRVLTARGVEVVDEPRPRGENERGKTYDRDTTIHPEDLELSRRVPLKALLGVLNSRLLHYYHANAIGGLLNVFPEHVRTLPIAHDEEVYARLADLVSDLIDLQRRRRSLVLHLPDYLGSYADGPDLPDLGLFQPSAANALDATTEDHDGLRIGEVRTDRDGDRVTVSATARYKPEDEDEHETDRWGYTETAFLDAFSLADLADEEAALVEAFVPVAVEEAGGFAGFRGRATKTNSIVDRLKAITLPDFDDVADDLRRYVEARERAEELDGKIDGTERRVDALVYDLYGLSAEEVEVVEAAVERDRRSKGVAVDDGN